MLCVSTASVKTRDSIWTFTSQCLLSYQLYTSSCLSWSLPNCMVGTRAICIVPGCVEHHGVVHGRRITAASIQTCSLSVCVGKRTRAAHHRELT